MIKTDCFAWNANKKCCQALNKTLCEKGECSFYKTKEQYERDFPQKVPLADRPVIRGDGKEYPTVHVAAAATSISERYIIACLRGEHKHAGGYSWQWSAG